MADMMTCKTVRIYTEKCKGNPEGIVEINEADYDASVYKLVDEAQPSLLTGDKPPKW